MKKWYSLIFAAFLGALLPLAFAPLGLSFLAILVPAGLIFVWEHSRSTREALLMGFVFGLFFFATGVYWIYYSIYTYGHSPLWLAYFLMLLLCLVLAWFPAVLGALSRLFPAPSSFRYLFIYPSLWVLLEGIRAIIGTGFPWLSLGYSQNNSFLSGFAPLIGVYGLSWLCVFLGTLLYIAYRQRRFLPLFIFLVIYALGFGLKQIQWGKNNPPALSVLLVQGNVTQEVKWDPTQLSNTIEHYLNMTEPYLGNADLVIWPEAAIPTLVDYVKPTLNHMNAVLKQYHMNLLTGIVDEDAQRKAYNALILLGDNQGQYYKRHLVPFGEYLPLENWLAPLLEYWQLPNSDLSPGPMKTEDLKINGIVMAPFICYEIIFPGLVRQSLPKAEVLITISDDAWFGDSSALNQHLQMAQMRSLEMARPQLFVSNSGITALIDFQGKIEQQLPIDIAQVLPGVIMPHRGWTPFMYYGSWPVWILSTLCLLFSAYQTKVYHQPN